MLIFHKNGDTIKVTNPVTNDITLTFPAVSCTVATEKDLDNITMVAGSINKPSIVSPLNNEVDFKDAFELTPYATNENFSGLQTHVTIEVSRDNSFTDLVVSQKLPITTNIVNLSIDLSLTKVYLRMKYHSNDYTSIWSDVVSFTTPEFYVIKPIILGPTGTSVSLIPYLSTNNFSYVGVTDTHESTTYQVATDSNFANIVYNITTTVDKTGHIVIEDLDYETTYYLRVRHTGTKYGNSVWSDTVMFKTIIIKNTFMEIVSPNTNGIRYHGVQVIDVKSINGIIYGWRDHPYYAKIDNNNTIVKEYEELGVVGGAMYDSIIDPDGNIIFVGHGIVNSINCLRILKVTPELVVLKEMNLTGILGNAYTIKRDSNGNYFVVGSSHTHLTGIAIKLDSNLNITIAKTFNLSNANLKLFLGSFEIDSNNNILIFGAAGTLNVEGTVILKYDNSLNRISSNVLNYYGNTTTITAGVVATTKDNNGNIYGVGTTRQWDNINNIVGRIYKFDSNGNIIKIKDIPNQSLVVDFTDICYYDGYLYATLRKCIILKLDLNLNLVKAIKFSRNNTVNLEDNDLYHFTMDKDGNIYAGGYYVYTSGQKCNALVAILDKDLDLVNGNTTNGLYNISNITPGLRDIAMTVNAITITEGSLSTTNLVINTTMTEVTDTKVYMDL